MATFREAFEVTCPLCHAPPRCYCVSIAKTRQGDTLATLHNERLRETDRLKLEEERKPC